MTRTLRARRVQASDQHHAAARATLDDMEARGLFRYPLPRAVHEDHEALRVVAAQLTEVLQ